MPVSENHVSQLHGIYAERTKRYEQRLTMAPNLAGTLVHYAYQLGYHRGDIPEGEQLERRSGQDRRLAERADGVKRRAEFNDALYSERFQAFKESITGHIKKQSEEIEKYGGQEERNARTDEMLKRLMVRAFELGAEAKAAAKQQ